MSWEVKDFRVFLFLLLLVFDVLFIFILSIKFEFFYCVLFGVMYCTVLYIGDLKSYIVCRFNTIILSAGMRKLRCLMMVRTVGIV